MTGGAPFLQRARYDGVSTRAVRTRGCGPLVVLLHGFADSADTWAGVQACLGASGRASLAVDLPGFGAAGPRADGPVLPQLRSFVEDLVAQESRRGPVVLVGNSLGSCAALLAAQAGAPVAGVVTTAEPTLGSSWLIRRFRRAPTSPLVRLLTLRAPIPGPLARLLAAAAVRRHLHSRAAAADPVVVRRFVAEMMRHGGHHRLIGSAHALALESVRIYDFEDFAVPLLIVHGARDRVIPVNSSRTLHQAVPHSELVVQADWGHCPQLDDPAGVARLIGDFVDGLGAAEEGATAEHG